MHENPPWNDYKEGKTDSLKPSSSKKLQHMDIQPSMITKLNDKETKISNLNYWNPAWNDYKKDETDTQNSLKGGDWNELLHKNI